MLNRDDFPSAVCGHYRSPHMVIAESPGVLPGYVLIVSDDMDYAGIWKFVTHPITRKVEWTGPESHMHFRDGGERGYITFDDIKTLMDRMVERHVTDVRALDDDPFESLEDVDDIDRQEENEAYVESMSKPAPGGRWAM